MSGKVSSGDGGASGAGPYKHGRLEAAILRAYAAIGRETPLKADCGQLCGAACCKDAERDDYAGGGTGEFRKSRAEGEREEVSRDYDEDRGESLAKDDSCDEIWDDGAPGELGMFLFPGEANLLSQEPGYRLFRIPFMGGKAWFLVCEGKCNRRMRPLACRIFPLAPQINMERINGGAGAVRARPDPRAARVCPLAGGERLAPSFRRAVTKALRLLAGEPEILEYMQRLSEYLDDVEGILNLLSK